MQANTNWYVGQPVQVICNFNGGRNVVCHGTVTRLTATQVVVLNQHGNTSKYWAKNGHVLGYAWPYITHLIVPRIS